jgi:hypothetical protein
MASHFKAAIAIISYANLHFYFMFIREMIAKKVKRSKSHTFQANQKRSGGSGKGASSSLNGVLHAIAHTEPNPRDKVL